MFPSALYLVCMNRFSQLVVAFTGLTIKTNYWTLPENISFVNYAPSALSNSLSSWAQYSALHYVSFPTQTLFKSSKIIPVMLMGKVLNGRSYPWAEYVEALFITFGISLFMLEGDVDNGKSGTKGTTNTSTDLFGVALLCLFVFSDCFTRYSLSSTSRPFLRVSSLPFTVLPCPSRFFPSLHCPSLSFAFLPFPSFSFPFLA
jgi:adenosine 3'-phospho 5'-phosphosulfate transporter B2